MPILRHRCEDGRRTKSFRTLLGSQSCPLCPEELLGPNSENPLKLNYHSRYLNIAIAVLNTFGISYLLPHFSLLAVKFRRRGKIWSNRFKSLRTEIGLFDISFADSRIQICFLSDFSSLILSLNLSFSLEFGNPSEKSSKYLKKILMYFKKN